MALLWSVIKREDSQKRPTDFFGTTKGSSSAYFKATKVGVLLNCCISHHLCHLLPHSCILHRVHRNSFAIFRMILGHKEFLKNSYKLLTCTVSTVSSYKSRIFFYILLLPILVPYLTFLFIYLRACVCVFFLWASVTNCCRAEQLSASSAGGRACTWGNKNTIGFSLFL